MKKKYFTLFYYLTNDTANDSDTITMIMKHEKSDKIIIFEYNEYLDCYIHFMKKNILYKKYYQINFIINNKFVVDSVLPSSYDKTGKYFNILDSIALKRKGYLSNVKEIDEYECLRPKRRLTFSYPQRNFDEDYFNYEKKNLGYRVNSASEELEFKFKRKYLILIIN